MTNPLCCKQQSFSLSKFCNRFPGLRNSENPCDWTLFATLPSSWGSGHAAGASGWAVDSEGAVPGVPRGGASPAGGAGGGPWRRQSH